MAVASQPYQPAQATATSRARRGSWVDVAIKVVAYTVLILLAVIMIVPFWFSVATSLKPQPDTISVTLGTALIPETVTLDAYRRMFEESELPRWFLNSVVVAVVWVLGRALFDSMAGYAFARMQFAGRNLVFLMVLSTLMIPGMVTIIPKFIILDELGLLNTYGALTLPFLSSAFGIFLMKQFFESIPNELEEAARLDGASRYRIFFQIVLPNAAPALTALTIFSFQASWNAFLEPLLFNSDQDLLTLPIGLAYFRQANVVDYPIQMAIAVVSTLPIAIVFFVFQRYFIESQASSGIKG